MQKTQVGSRRKLSLISLAAATYFMVSGGPYGVEEPIRTPATSSPAMFYSIIPIFWALPTGLMVGELSAAMPQEGGFFLRMGPPRHGSILGFQEAWLSLVASIFDMAIYPSLFVAYLGKLFPAPGLSRRGIAIAAGLIMLCLIWNMFGAKAVGESSVVVGILLLSPFAVLTVIALLRHIAPAASTPSDAQLPHRKFWWPCGTIWDGTTLPPSPTKLKIRRRRIHA